MGLTRQSVRTPVPIWAGVFYTLNLSPISRIFLETSSAIVLFSVYAILALSCATTEYLEKGNISFGKEIDQKTTMDTIVYVLSEHGFGIQMINESFGLTESDWKQTSDIADNIGTTILLGTLTGNNTYYNRYLKLNFRVTETGFTVSPLSNTESQKSNNLLISSILRSNFFTPKILHPRLPCQIHNISIIKNNPIPMS